MEATLLQKFHESSTAMAATCVPRLTSTDPLPRELTIVFRFDSKVHKIIEKLQAELQESYPHLFYYPSNQLHVTLLARLPLHTNHEMLEQFLREHVAINKIQFRFWGTCMGKFSSSVSLYPKNFSLYDFRTLLRTKLHTLGSDFTIHLPEYEYVGWMNFARNIESIPNEEYRSIIMKYSEHDFGIYAPIAIECLENESWVLDPKKSTRVFRIDL